MKVLFLCTGNYYRSRFAELLFNHLVSEAGLPHHADSRALALERGSGNVGPISASTADALTARGVKMPARHRSPRQASQADFVDFDLIIALKEAEHRPLMTQRFPAHADRVQYWHVHDLDAATPQEALTQIETNVRQLIASLSVSATAAPRAGPGSTDARAWSSSLACRWVKFLHARYASLAEALRPAGQSGTGVRLPGSPHPLSLRGQDRAGPRHRGFADPTRRNEQPVQSTRP